MVINMEFNKVISERRSIRKFQEKSVSDNQIKQAIQNGLLAPSAHNRQPWKFYLTTTQEKNAIASALYEKTKNISGHTGPHTATIIKDAPALLIIYYDNDNQGSRDMDLLSIGACIENITLSLVDEGLSSVWIGNTNLINDEMKNITNLSYDTISCLAIGYQDQYPHPRPRKAYEEVVINKERQ